MDWKALFQSLFSRAVWETVLILGGGTVIGIVKAKWPNYAPRFLYGAGGAACIAVLLFTMTGRAIFSSPPSETTPDNIEANLRSWLDTFGMTVQKQTDKQFLDEAYFSFLVTPKPDSHILILRPKIHDRFITFRGKLAISPDELGKLSKNQRYGVLDQMFLELSRSRIGFSLANPDKAEFFVEDEVPITASFTEYTLIKELVDMQAIMMSTSQVAHQTMERYSESKAARPY